MKRTAILLALFSAAPAFAQTRAKTVPSPAPTQRIDITEADTVEGSVASGDGTIVSARRRLRMPSLIRPRSDFTAQMLRTAENL